MRKKLVAILLTLTVVCALIPLVQVNAQAATTQEVAARLAALSGTSGYRPGELKGDTGGCWRFVNKVSKNIFKVAIPGGTSGKYKLNSSKNWTIIDKSYHGSTATNANIIGLLKSAYPGDIIQYQGSAQGSSQHTAMIANVTDSGITIYDQAGSRGIGWKEHKWSDLLTKNGIGTFSTSISNNGMSLYRYKNYSTTKISTSNPTPGTATAPTVTTNAISSPAPLSVSLGGIISNPGGMKITACGVSLNTSDYSYGDVGKDQISSNQTRTLLNMKYDRIELKPDTEYYYFAWVEADGKIYTGNRVNFKTTSSSAKLPTISLIGSSQIILYLDSGTPYTEQGARAYDHDGTNISSLIKLAGVVNRNEPGSYQITYSVTSPSSGLSASVTREVQIVSPTSVNTSSLVKVDGVFAYITVTQSRNMELINVSAATNVTLSHGDHDENSSYDLVIYDSDGQQSKIQRDFHDWYGFTLEPGQRAVISLAKGDIREFYFGAELLDNSIVVKESPERAIYYATVHAGQTMTFTNNSLFNVPINHGSIEDNSSYNLVIYNGKGEQVSVRRNYNDWYGFTIEPGHRAVVSVASGSSREFIVGTALLNTMLTIS